MNGESLCAFVPHRMCTGKPWKHTENMISFLFFNFCLKKKVLLEEEDSLNKKNLKKGEKCNNRPVKEVQIATSKCV